MGNKKWRFRYDFLGHYINDSSNRTFQDVEDRLNYLEEKESQPDMIEKVKEYISELDAEIDRCNREMEELESDETIIDEVRDRVELCNITRIQTLTDVKNDLQGRLEELV